MPIKAVLFDLDNTLIDFLKMKKSASRSAISAMIKAGLDVNKRVAWNTLISLFQEYGIENQQIFNEFLKKLTGKVDVRILAAGVVAYRKSKELSLQPYPNVIPTLKKLKKRGYKLGIVTDAPKFQAWTRLYQLRLEKYFDLVITFEDTGKKKPSQLPFKTAIRKLRMKPEEIMMVGDSIKRDVEGARKLGMKTVFAEYGKVWKEKGRPDFVINDFSEILDYLNTKV